MHEEFKTIKNFDNYLISNFGNVKNKKTNRILKPCINSKGYFDVILRKYNKNYHKVIHRLIGESFIENPYNKLCIDHIDNNKLNNNVDNLRWCTSQENSQNSKLSSKNTSGYKGVYFNKPYNKWMSYINIDGIKINLGYYENIEDAKQARIKKANEVFGVYINVCEK